jgi:hypothetical protein
MSVQIDINNSKTTFTLDTIDDLKKKIIELISNYTITPIQTYIFIKDNLSFDNCNFDDIKFVNKIVFGDEFNLQTDLRKFTKLNEITFGKKFNKKLNQLPDQLKKISLGNGFNNKSVNLIPDSVEFLSFGNKFDKPISKYPTNLETLIFGKNFNQSLDNLPSSLINITFGCSFNQPINNLPEKLSSLFFDSSTFSYFNQPINNLPNSLKKIVFSYNFNQSIDYLPNSVEELVLGYDFNHSIDNLPNSVKILRLDYKFKKPIKILPNNLKELYVKEPKSIENLPDTIEILEIEKEELISTIDKFPKMIKQLKFNMCFCHFNTNENRKKLMDIKKLFESEYNTYYSSNSKLSNWTNMTLNLVSKNQDVDNLCVVKKFYNN